MQITNKTNELLHRFKTAFALWRPRGSRLIWHTILITFGLVLAVSFTVNGYFLYRTIQSEQGLEAGVSSSVSKKIPVDDLKTVLRIMENRNLQYQKDLQGVPVVVDPSL